MRAVGGTQPLDRLAGVAHAADGPHFDGLTMEIRAARLRNHIVLASGGLVEVWSKRRLQFEPQGASVEMRRELRSHLLELIAGNRWLYAEYISEDDSLCDVENVLIYNVGATSFRNAASQGLVFERGYSSPPPPPQGFASEFAHYSRYRLAEADGGFHLWRQSSMLGSWGPLDLSGLNPASIWADVKRSDPRGLGAQSNLASVVKPILDGVIAAFHGHDGTDNDRVATHLSGYLGETREQMDRWLLNNQANALGKLRLIWPRGQGVQWNPADDRCMAVEVSIGLGGAASATFGGELFSVEQTQQ